MAPYGLCASVPSVILTQVGLTSGDGLWDTCAWVEYHGVVEYVNRFFRSVASDNVYYVQMGEAPIGVGLIQGRGWHIGTSLGVFVDGSDYATTKDSGSRSDGRKL